MQAVSWNCDLYLASCKSRGCNLTLRWMTALVLLCLLVYVAAPDGLMYMQRTPASLSLQLRWTSAKPSCSPLEIACPTPYLVSQ
jgi:hypothetical protein